MEIVLPSHFPPLLSYFLQFLILNTFTCMHKYHALHAIYSTYIQDIYTHPHTYTSTNNWKKTWDLQMTPETLEQTDIPRRQLWHLRSNLKSDTYRGNACLHLRSRYPETRPSKFQACSGHLFVKMLKRSFPGKNKQANMTFNFHRLPGRSWWTFPPPFAMQILFPFNYTRSRKMGGLDRDVRVKINI